MELRPVPEQAVSLRKKSDELFLRWLSEKETREFFRNLFKTPLNSLVKGQLSLSELSPLAESTDASKPRAPSPNAPPGIPLATAVPAEEIAENCGSFTPTPDTHTLAPDAVDAVNELFSSTTSPGEQQTVLIKIASVSSVFSSALQRSLGSEVNNGEAFNTWWTRVVHNTDEPLRIHRILRNPRYGNLRADDLAAFVRDVVDFVDALRGLLIDPKRLDRYVRSTVVKLQFLLMKNLCWCTAADFRNKRSLKLITQLNSLTPESALDEVHRLLSAERFAHLNQLPLPFNFIDFSRMEREFVGLDRDGDGVLGVNELRKFQNRKFHWRFIERAFRYLRVPSANAPASATFTATYSLEDFTLLNCVVSALDTKRSMRLWFPVADVDLDGSINSFDFQHHFDYQIFRLEEFFIQPPNPEAVLQDLNTKIMSKTPGVYTYDALLKGKKGAGQLFRLLFDIDFLRTQKTLYHS